MAAKQLKMSLLQVFSEMTTQKSGLGQKSCIADEQACVFGSFECNKHSVLKIFMINGLNFQTLNLQAYRQDQALNQNRSVRSRTYLFLVLSPIFSTL